MFDPFYQSPAFTYSFQAYQQSGVPGWHKTLERDERRVYLRLTPRTASQVQYVWHEDGTGAEDGTPCIKSVGSNVTLIEYTLDYRTHGNLVGEEVWTYAPGVVAKWNIVEVFYDPTRAHVVNPFG